MIEQSKKILIIYKSKYGSTKKYAKWIANRVKADLVERSNVRPKDFNKYDTIVFGGFLHAVGISGVKIITDNFEKIINKKIIVFAVGCSPRKENALKHVLSNNFNDNMKEKIDFFYLRGAFNYKKLGFIDKMMMNALRIKINIRKKEELDEDSKGLLECFDKPVDWTDERDIDPIIECISRK